MNEFIQVCKLDQIPDDTALALEIDGKPVALFKIGERCYAIEDICPHQGASFEGGPLDGEIVTCPLHGWRMNIATGASLEVPSITVETYEVKVIDGDVFLRMT